LGNRHAAACPDKFGLGEVLDTGAMLLGRRTWELFAKIWPGRDDPFSAKLNAMPKLVVSRSLENADGWQNSADRLLVFPLVLGEGTRLFPDGTAP
jgi:dihydrofolate reductase